MCIRDRSLETPAYFDMIREMLKKYAQPEAGTIRFSKKDLERMPEGFETEIQNIAGEKGGSLALEKDPADLDGGFILISVSYTHLSGVSARISGTPAI